jgi:hypothetical protein
MTQKIAVVVIHGIGDQREEFADDVIREISRRCSPKTGQDIVIGSVYWADLLRAEETELMWRLNMKSWSSLAPVRRYMIDFVADAIAYQITPHDRKLYDAIHQRFAMKLRELATLAGERAPLCIVAHSLGSVIASNFIYDLQNAHKGLIAQQVEQEMEQTPLERGETLTLLYTLGSPIALWSLRFENYGTPITFPAPQLHTYYPDIPYEWVNFYDKQDVIGFRLKALNAEYKRMVTEDREIDVGSRIVSLTPFSHLRYLVDHDVLEPIAEKLIAVWTAINPAQGDA